MVPAQGVGFHEDQREDGEDRERYDLLNHLEFPDRERTSEFGAADAVGGDLEAVFEQRDAPAQQNDGRQPEAFEPRFEGDMPVPRQRHKGVGDDEQQNGGETPEHRIQIFKPRKSSKLFDMISSRQQKYALVTGASSGIGREYAAQLAAKGYDLVMAGNRDEENRAAAREIAARYGVRTLPLCMDLSEPDAAVKLHAETSARGIEIGVLVCNAGVLLFGPLAAAPPERIGRIVTLHCTTPALLCRLYGEEMRRRGEGYILVMSSATAWMPYPTIAAYAATKSFLRTFARSLNFEFRKYGVRVTGVFPGAVDTPLYDLDAACRRRLLRWGVMSAPQEVAQHGLRALFRGRSSCIPGVFTKICVCVCRLVPAWLMRCVLRIPAVARLF